MLCAACGTENRPGSKFCDHCGASLAARCPSCGEPNRTDARFCASCGHALSDQPAASPAIETPPSGPAAAQAAGAERRLVSVLFTDLVGFTTLAEDRDPEAVRELLSRYFDRATEIVQLHGGTVEKFIGDAVMAVWGAPTAHEDDAERAVRAALELVAAVRGLHPSLQARAGVLTGEAAVTIGATNQGLVAGDLVNTAARLQGVAEPGTVLVGEATRRAAESAIVFEPLGDQSLKGKTAPVPAWVARRVVAQVGGQGRTDTLEAPFVGREEELRQLKETLHAVGRERRVRLVSITGPGGIGKSRLAWELLKYIDGVAEDVWWHRGRSPSYGEGITFLALGEMVRRRAGLTEEDDESTTRERIRIALEEHVRDAAERETIGPALLTLLGVEPAPAGGRDVLFPAWRTFFERIAEQGTTVLVFEDLQWADTGLLDFIDHLLDWSRGLPIMIITLARPELFDKRPDWGAGRRHLTALALEPLPDAAVRQLLDGLVPGLPADAMAAIVARAEGMPLYAVETVRALLADGRLVQVGDRYEPVGDLSQLRVPESLRSLIASRLDALDPADRSLLQDAAVLGQVFIADALAGVAGVELGALEPRLRDLVRRELLDIERDPQSPERGMYKFVQSLIREVAYDTLGRRDRRARHLAVARHFEAVGDAELAGVLASHYLAAHAASDEGPEATALAGQARLALVGAAERAADLGAPDDAVGFLKQALTVTHDAADRAPLLERLAECAAIAAREDAVEFGRAAIAAHQELGDRQAAVSAAARRGSILIDASDIAAAIEVLEHARDEAQALDVPITLAEALARLARAYFRSGRHRESVAAADRAIEIADPLEHDGIVAEAFCNIGAAYGFLGRGRQSIAMLRAATALAHRAGNTGLEIRALNNLGAVLGEEDLAEAVAVLEQAAAQAQRVGNRGNYDFIVTVLAGLNTLRGQDWDAEVQRLNEALESSTLPADRGRIIGFRASFFAARGERLDELVAETDEAYGEFDDADARSFRAYVAAEVAQVRGDLDVAYRRWLESAESQPQDQRDMLVNAVRCALWARRPDWVARPLALLGEVLGSSAVTAAHRVWADACAHALADRRDAAMAAFRDAIRAWQVIDAQFSAALVAVDAAVAYPSDPEARSWAEAARPILESLRARPYLERLDDALSSAASDASQPRASSRATTQGAGAAS
jgi:class 3 adenylate cyclase/tetratricopeptide (TPR) repeat protein